ncbi:MAG: 3-phosphoshikimate 1-carboxyvinyltransferase [Bacteroidetes bacterium]|nr:MAG: 3-phosphoshikimate 1-carboxyvinyltransferase [Bacteroidota bacterium]TNF29557.1 MAG: 3-phosphoshikimate 1-carboxyvinyltransferase [Deltaproteobacteria bacterium]
MIKKVSKRKLFGTIHVPPSKSDAQRAVLAASLANGSSQIYNLGASNDELAMLNNSQVLGAAVSRERDHYMIKGGIHSIKELEINVGESGLGLRLLTPVSLLFSSQVKIQGEGSILDRSQHFLVQQLTAMGVKVVSQNGFLPITLSGELRGGEHQLDGSVSSQLLSGLLMSMPLLEEDSLLHVNNLKSTPYVSMTLQTLKEFGICIENRNFEEFHIRGNQRYQPTKYSIEADWSSASFWLVAGALGHQIKLTGLSMESEQADRRILEAFKAANCTVDLNIDGITVRGENKTAFEFDCTHCPDLFPALCTLAAFCEGTTVLKGANRLKHKESDRATALIEEFSKLGVAIQKNDDVLKINGGTIDVRAQFDSHNDHRIAMCLAIAGTLSDQEMIIHGAEAVNKSYPEFWDDLSNL